MTTVLSRRPVAVTPFVQLVEIAAPPPGSEESEKQPAHRQTAGRIQDSRDPVMSASSGANFLALPRPSLVVLAMSTKMIRAG